MSNNKIVEDLARDMLFLKQEVERLSRLTPLYEVLNQSPVENVTTDHNNYTLGNYDMIFLTPTANRTIRGITGGVKGRLLFLRNTSAAFTLTFPHLDAAATTGNKIVTATAGSIVLANRQTAIFSYVSDSGLGGNFWLLLIPGA